MLNLRLRKNVVVAAYRNSYRVILTMFNGFELDVGEISQEASSGRRKHWAWSAPGANGQAETLDDAMEAFRAAWSAVTPETLGRMRKEQQWTANKHALWEFGYRNLLGRGPIECRCGEMFDPGIPEEIMAHISHITGRRAGT